MSALVNFVISFIMGFLFGHQIKEPQTAHHEIKKDSLEIFEKLEARQHMLDC